MNTMPCNYAWPQSVTFSWLAGGWSFSLDKTQCSFLFVFTADKIRLLSAALSQTFALAVNLPPMFSYNTVKGYLHANLWPFFLQSGTALKVSVPPVTSLVVWRGSRHPPNNLPDHLPQAEGCWQRGGKDLMLSSFINTLRHSPCDRLNFRAEWEMKLYVTFLLMRLPSWSI